MTIYTPARRNRARPPRHRAHPPRALPVRCPPAGELPESCHASVAERTAGSAARTAWHEGRRIGCDFGSPADGHELQDRRTWGDLRQVGSHELPAALGAHGVQAVELAVSLIPTDFLSMHGTRRYSGIS